MRVFWAILWVLFSAVGLTDELYFMPYEKDSALKALIGHFDNAKTQINVSIYSFTNKEIAKSLKDASNRGVRVNIIYDKASNLNNKQSTIGYLAKYKNINACVLEGLQARNYKGIMHQKMAIIDDKHLALGSANWSKSAFEFNYETLLITQNKDFISKALKTFEDMKKVCKKY